MRQDHDGPGEVRCRPPFLGEVRKRPDGRAPAEEPAQVLPASTTLPVDDEQLLAAAVTETSRHLGVELQPTATAVTRWRDAFPQYRPHHHQRVAAAEAALPTGLHLAGASYHGIGVPACIASGLKAAQRVAETPGGGGR